MSGPLRGIFFDSHCTSQLLTPLQQAPDKKLFNFGGDISKLGAKIKTVHG